MTDWFLREKLDNMPPPPLPICFWLINSEFYMNNYLPANSIRFKIVTETVEYYSNNRTSIIKIMVIQFPVKHEKALSGGQISGNRINGPTLQKILKKKKTERDTNEKRVTGKQQLKRSDREKG